MRSLEGDRGDGLVPGNFRDLQRAAAAIVGLAAAAALLSGPGLRAQAARHEREHQRENRATHHLDSSKINDPNTKDPVGPHAQGEAVVRAAILLDRLKFSPGEIGTDYNDDLAKAIAAFQSAARSTALPGTR